jgi:hypothetical protein
MNYITYFSRRNKNIPCMTTRKTVEKKRHKNQIKPFNDDYEN